MNRAIRKTAVPFRIVTTLVLPIFVAALPLAVAAQPNQFAAAMNEKLLEYSQCIRDHGVPGFPDPTPDGRMNVRLEQGDVANFQTAQQQCKDKLPSEMLAAQEPPTPERMEALVKFAACVRDDGIADFPDPGPDGAFVLGGSTEGSTAPRMQEVFGKCMMSHPIGGLSIRRVQAQP